MEIRLMMTSDVEFAFACTRAEGWLGETKEVFETFLAHDPQGCFVAEHEGRAVGICVATRYRSHGFIGELVVAEDMRGQGIGEALFRTAIDYLRSSAIEHIYLDGDLPAVPIYERAGFRKICRSLRFVGTVTGGPCSDVRSFLPSDMSSVGAIDRELFGDDRSDFLERRLAIFGELCFVLERRGRVVGYVMGRKGLGVVSVGPWVSRGSARDGICLLRAVASQAGGEPLRVGVLETNPRAVRIVRSCGVFEEHAPCWRMMMGRDERLGIHDDLLAIGSAAKG